MPLSFDETLAVAEMTAILYSFLPGSGFASVAARVGVLDSWAGGSKSPAISRLLEQTLEQRRRLFCDLIKNIVAEGIKYRSRKGSPITREEIEALNQQILRVRFKIPELYEPKFLDSLPRLHPSTEATETKFGPTPERLTQLQRDLVVISKLAPANRGYEFEKFLNALFTTFSLAPRAPFRIQGEQIDGSFAFEGDVYLVEAKWQDALVSQADLLVFSGKVGGKTTWGRGLFISYNDFSKDGLAAFAKGRPSNLIAMNGQDLSFILEGKMTLPEAIRLKSRRAAETGQIMVSVYELSLEGY